MKYRYSPFFFVLSAWAVFSFGALSVDAAVIDPNTKLVPGLRGTYYDTTGDPITRDERNSDIAVIRTDAGVSFQWNDTSPAPVASEFFTAEWKGNLRAPETGVYAFAVM